MLPVPGVHVSALLPYDAGSLLSRVREYGNVDSVDYRADGIWIERMWTADSPPRSSIGRSMRRTVMAAITSMPSMMSIECSTIAADAMSVSVHNNVTQITLPSGR